jgi:hypothetical protein
MSKFFIQQTKYCIRVFASQKIFENQIIETGKVNSFHKFSSNDKLYWGPRQYACISGSYLHYKPDLYPNCKLKKNYHSKKYHVIALHDINKNEELTRIFDSLQFSISGKQLKINMK